MKGLARAIKGFAMNIELARDPSGRAQAFARVFAQNPTLARKAHQRPAASIAQQLKN
jgi:hypothetical protein